MLNVTYLYLYCHIKRGVFTNFGRDTWKDILYSDLNVNAIKSKNILVSANPKFNGYFIAKEFKSTKVESTQKIKWNKLHHFRTTTISWSDVAVCYRCYESWCKYLEVYTEDEYAHSLP